MRFTGSSHDEHGLLTKDPAKVGRLNEHLWRKIEDHADEIALAKADLQGDARTLFISYGITARAMAEAVHSRPARRAAPSPRSPSRACGRCPKMRSGALCGPSCSTTVERVVVAELNLGDFRREVERVHLSAGPRRRRRPAPEIVGINRVDGELITPGQFLEAMI